MIWITNLVKCFLFCVLIFVGHPRSTCSCFAEPIGEKSSIRDEVRLSAEDALDRLERTYREFKSYTDSGFSVRKWSLSEGSEVQTRYEFHTAFQRDVGFRFAFRVREDFDRTFGAGRIVWHDGAETLLSEREGSGKLEVQESLGIALASITGVSAGIAHTVPALLMPKTVGGRQITKLSVDGFATVEVIDGVKCYRVEGTFDRRSGDKKTLWVDKCSFLLLKMEEHSDIDGRPLLQITKYFPTANTRVSPKLLKNRIDNEW
jgi:hypothetical protein